MATVFASTHSHSTHGLRVRSGKEKRASRGVISIFIRDLIEDLRQKPLQPMQRGKHDLFREHINAMAICYFALIVVLIASSLPILGYLVQY